MSNKATPSAGSGAIGRAGAWVLGNRALVRAPIWLYRARLGYLFGSRTLMLEHVGRKSGARRFVVLEVVGHRTPDTYVVSSGFGERAQWLRNLTANPRARVSVAGHGPRAATARRLPVAEADAVLAGYIRQHPRAWAKLKVVMANTLGTAISEHGTPLPMVELRLDGPAPAPSADPALPETRHR